MLSKAHIHMRGKLRTICNKFNVELLEEVKSGDKRYDFYIPTFPPVVIEVDGTNHNLNKADGFFFKDSIQLAKYKKNDLERNKLNKKGSIVLYRFTDKEFPSIVELLDIIDIELLKKGDNEKDAFLKDVRYAEELKRRRNEQAKIARDKKKVECSDRARPIKKLSRYSYSGF